MIDLRDGTVLAKLPLCGDADDVFFDARRHRLYAVCGEGVVDVFEDRPPEATGGGSRPTQPHRIGRVATAVGARTGLFVSELDRLFVAARAGPAGPAAVWVLRPDSSP